MTIDATTIAGMPASATARRQVAGRARRRNMLARTALAAVLLGLCAAGPIGATDVRVAWIDARGEDSILVLGGLVAFHGGEVDWYDHDRPPSDLLARALHLMFGSAWYAIQQQIAWAWPDAEVRSFMLRPTAVGGFGIPPPNWPQYDAAGARLDPVRHRYLSFLLPVQPSNDAFVGNEDPRRYPLFDDEGHFLGPFFIDVFGSDVQDAGSCDNTESGLAWLDRPAGAPQPCSGGEGTVRTHPGLNGSLRNPDGTPVGVLGATSTAPYTTIHHFDATAADFSRPGQHLGRLVVSSFAGGIDASGSWYSPERAGEGFSLQVLPPDAPGQASRALVYWYTYAPDGSGRQVWLTGVGDITGGSAPIAQISLHRTQGGRFASTGNPQDVVTLPWGSLSLVFTGCDRAEVSYHSAERDYGNGAFAVHRLGPPVEGLGWMCAGDAWPAPAP